MGLLVRTSQLPLEELDAVEVMEEDRSVRMGCFSFWSPWVEVRRRGQRKRGEGEKYMYLFGLVVGKTC